MRRRHRVLRREKEGVKYIDGGREGVVEEREGMIEEGEGLG